MRFSRLSRLALAASLLTVAGCKPKEAEGPTTSTPASAAGVIVGDKEVVAIDHPVQMLPRDTQLVGWVSGANRLAEVFERNRLAQAFPKPFSEFSRESSEAVGWDLSDPAAYRDVGIDPSGRMGAALISARAEVGAFFFTLADEGKFIEMVRSKAGQRQITLTTKEYGPSTLLASDKEVSIVVRDGLAMVVVADDPPGEGGVDYGEMIAKLDPRQSLAASVEYRKALGGLRDTDAMAYMNLGLLYSDANLAREEARAEDVSWAEKEVVAAKERGAEAEEIERLEQQAADDAAWEDKWEARRAAERQIVETLLDGLEGIGMALSVKRTGPVVDGQMVMREDAFLRRLVVTDSKPLSLPKALNGAPIIFWGGKVDVDAALELADLFAQSEGANIHDDSKKMKSDVLGINPETELFPLLTGEAAMAVTLEAEPDFAHLDELPKQIGLTFELGISDPAKVEALLGKIDKSNTLAGLAVSNKDGAYQFSVPEFRTMQAAVAGNKLVVTTDPGLAGRLVTGAEGSMKRDTHPPGPYYVMTLPNVGGAWVTDIRYLAGFFFASFSAGDVAFDMKAEAGMPSWDEVEKSRMSRAAKKKKDELDAAKKELDEARADVDGAQAKAVLDAMGAFGTTAFVLQPNARGFSIAGGQFIGTDTLGGVVESIMRLSENGPERDVDRSKLDAARTKHNQLDQEYRELRMKDWEKANKGGRRKAKVQDKK